MKKPHKFARLAYVPHMPEDDFIFFFHAFQIASQRKSAENAIAAIRDIVVDGMIPAKAIKTHKCTNAVRDTLERFIEFLQSLRVVDKLFNYNCTRIFNNVEHYFSAYEIARSAKYTIDSKSIMINMVFEKGYFELIEKTVHPATIAQHEGFKQFLISLQVLDGFELKPLTVPLVLGRSESLDTK